MNGQHLLFLMVKVLLMRKKAKKTKDLVNKIESSSAGLKIRIHRIRAKLLLLNKIKKMLAKKVNFVF